jgi:hypothetical protein
MSFQNVGGHVHPVTSERCAPEQNHIVKGATQPGFLTETFGSSELVSPSTFLTAGWTTAHTAHTCLAQTREDRELGQHTGLPTTNRISHYSVTSR